VCLEAVIFLILEFHDSFLEGSRHYKSDFMSSTCLSTSRKLILFKRRGRQLPGTHHQLWIKQEKIKLPDDECCRQAPFLLFTWVFLLRKGAMKPKECQRKLSSSQELLLETTGIP
jgi:hypothetical protein